MKNVKTYLIFSLFLLTCVAGFSGRVYAQTDYVVTNDNTKLMGEITTFDLSKLKFRAVGEKKKQKYRPDQIKEAYKAGYGLRRSISVKKNKKKSFLEVLEDGEIKLYQHFQRGNQGGYVAHGYGSTSSYLGGSGPVQYWYAQKEGGEIVEIKSNGIWGSRKTRKDNFFNLVQDNAHVAERYQKEDKFNFDFVRSLIVEYNGLKVKTEQNELTIK